MGTEMAMKVSKIVLTVAVLLAGDALSVLAQSPDTFTATGSMITPRAEHTATLLTTGKVLIAGGYGLNAFSAPQATAELFDPSTGAFTPTGSMSTPRNLHTATSLADGRVLIVGGRSNTQDLATAELYDPSTGAFTPTGAMNALRGLNAAALLDDGRVLVTGCAIPCNSAIAELYDPGTGAFTLADTPGTAGTATLLADGRVLTAGGGCAPDGSAAAQLFDPGSDTFNFTGRIPHTCDDINTATLLTNGKVLFAGNEENDGSPADAELYDTAAGTFLSLGYTIGPHEYAAATLIPDGTVLLTGGQLPGGNGDSDAELFSPTTGAFSLTASMNTQRHLHTATLLPDGTILVAGGFSFWPNPTASAELYHPPVLVSAPLLFSLSGDGQGQGAIWNGVTGLIVSPTNPATVGDVLSMYTTSLAEGGAIPPRVAVGGKLAEILYFGDAPGYPGYFQVNFRVPDGVAPGSAVSVCMTYLDRSSNAVTISVK